MTRAELLAEFRTVTNDIASPPLVSDDRAIRLMAEGQDRFCEETGFFTDFSTFTVTTAVDIAGDGIKSYALDSRIIEVKEVWDGARRLNRYSQNDRPKNLYWPYADLSVNGNRAPMNWQTDNETGMLTLFENPTAGIVLSLRSWRYALSPLTRKSSTITLGGVLHTGDTITVTVNDTVYSYTTLVTDASLSAVATALAAVIRAGGIFNATASGQVVTISAVNLSVSTTATAAISGAGATTTAITADFYSANPEIPVSLHLALAEWAAFRVFNDHDRESYDPTKAALHKKNWMEYVRRGQWAFDRINGASPKVSPSPQYVV